MSDAESNHLRNLFSALQEQLAAELGAARLAVEHAGAKGEASEGNWLGMLRAHLPLRYQATKGFVIDCTGARSEQVDIVVHDRQYTPLFYNKESQVFIPVEGVYAVLEVKQETNRENVVYAGNKAASVRRLRRTSAPIAHAGGSYDAKALPQILAGILAYQSGWTPPLGEALVKVLEEQAAENQLDLGCVVTGGAFEVSHRPGAPLELSQSHPSVALSYFFIRLLDNLQRQGTVPAIDYGAYSKHLKLD